jgi:hypothetical protein
MRSEGTAQSKPVVRSQQWADLTNRYTWSVIHHSRDLSFKDQLIQGINHTEDKNQEEIIRDTLVWDGLLWHPIYYATYFFFIFLTVLDNKTLL